VARDDRFRTRADNGSPVTSVRAATGTKASRLQAVFSTRLGACSRQARTNRLWRLTMLGGTTPRMWTVASHLTVLCLAALLVPLLPSRAEKPSAALAGRE